MTSGQAELMQTLHDDHAAALWSYCLRLTERDHTRAQDVVQETLLRAWRHPEVLERPKDAVRAWLFRVARNVVIDEWRSRRTHPEHVMTNTPEPREHDDATDRMLVSWVVAEALNRLSEDHRRVLVECYYNSRPVKEVARRLGVPEGTVKSRTHYALRALRLSLEEIGGVW